MQRIDLRRIQGAWKTATGGGRVSSDGPVGVRKAGTEVEARQRTEDKAAREKCVRFGVIAAKQHVAAKFDGVAAADHGDVVRELVAAEDRIIRQENIGAQIIREPGDL